MTPSSNFYKGLAALPSDRDRDNFKWLYEASRDGDFSTLMHGMMMGCVVGNPGLTYLQVLDAVRRVALRQQEKPHS